MRLGRCGRERLAYPLPSPAMVKEEAPGGDSDLWVSSRGSRLVPKACLKGGLQGCRLPIQPLARPRAETEPAPACFLWAEKILPGLRADQDPLQSGRSSVCPQVFTPGPPGQRLHFPVGGRTSECLLLLFPHPACRLPVPQRQTPTLFIRQGPAAPGWFIRPWALPALCSRC
ncbi:unnamed protein product [Rangifer tarandus platyrhynchus]|uniref:Uncharacterized protein n=1 Tax=Rangifer tarandus platyrhynchus TaxID=3082113 RepID=A0ABN8ZEM5_RANTA|nr:unnamed protein product [Rangifer tarandus platyrhynchus]